MSRQALGPLIAAMALAGMAACSGASARSDAQQRDSPPPKPMPAPQVVARKSTDPVFDASTVAALFPMPTQDLLVAARSKARKEWRADATITRVRYQWVFNPPDTHSWVGVTVNSPGDGAQRNYSFGDVYDGKVFDFDMTGRADAKARATERAIGDVRAGLEEATATAWKLGYREPFSEIDLEVVGARGKPHVPAWRLLGTTSGAGLFPLTINALTGGVMDWRDAYQTPNWSDAEIAATFRRLFRVPPPRNLGVERLACADIGGNWMPWEQCDR